MIIEPAQTVDSAISSQTKPVSNVPKVPVVPNVQLLRALDSATGSRCFTAALRSRHVTLGSDITIQQSLLSPLVHTAPSHLI
jgi:hypothetical protein